MNIYFATRLRGFFLHLIKADEIDAKFSYDNNKVYETNSWKTKLKVIVAHWRIMDWLGLIQEIKCIGKNVDIIGSFNRFINSDIPYFIYVENPTALYHYRLDRNKSFFGKRRLNKLINSPMLRGLVFMSNACASTFENVCCKIPEKIHTDTIYPLVPANPLVNEALLEERCQRKRFKLLYIAQGIRFVSKGGLEVAEAFKRLREEGLDIELQMITSLHEADSDKIKEVTKIEGITVNDFKLSFEEMLKIYAESSLLLIPTSDDSFNLTVLEGIKAGLPVIGSRLYAIPEMVEDNVNGYLCDPHFWFFDKNNIPNPEVWNHRKKTLYKGDISESIVTFLTDHIHSLYNNRGKLLEMSKQSLWKSCNSPFSENYIVKKWNKFFEKI